MLKEGKGADLIGKIGKSRGAQLRNLTGTENSVSGDGEESPGAPSPEEQQNFQPTRIAKKKYWTGNFILTNVVVLFLALVAGYFEYVAYPALMSGPSFPYGAGFGETNVVLNLSFLTFQVTATNTITCATPNCVLKGIPAFDFCQALVYLVILMNLAHFVRSPSK